MPSRLICVWLGYLPFPNPTTQFSHQFQHYSQRVADSLDSAIIRRQKQTLTTVTRHAAVRETSGSCRPPSMACIVQLAPNGLLIGAGRHIDLSQTCTEVYITTLYLNQAYLYPNCNRAQTCWNRWR
jgi:hypothetical protein